FAFAAVPDEVLISAFRAETPSDVATRVVVSIADRERKKIEIILPKVRDTISIHVADDRGYPADRVEIRALSLDVGVPLRRTIFTDKDGDAELPDAVGLPLRFTLVRPTKAPKIEEVEAAPSKMKFELSDGIRGKGEITARDGRDRIPGASITVF